VVGWLIAGAALGGTAVIERRRQRREAATA